MGDGTYRPRLTKDELLLVIEALERQEDVPSRYLVRQLKTWLADLEHARLAFQKAVLAVPIEELRYAD